MTRTEFLKKWKIHVAFGGGFLAVLLVNISINIAAGPSFWGAALNALREIKLWNTYALALLVFIRCLSSEGRVEQCPHDFEPEPFGSVDWPVLCRLGTARTPCLERHPTVGSKRTSKDRCHRFSGKLSSPLAIRPTGKLARAMEGENNDYESRTIVIAAAIYRFWQVFVGTAQAQSRVDFSLRALDGEPVTAESLRGEVAVLAFSPSWLPLSRISWRHQETGRQLQRTRCGCLLGQPIPNHPNQRTTLPTITGERWGASTRLPCCVILRRGFEEAGADQLPSIVIFDKEGNIFRRPIGGMDPNANLATQLSARLDKFFKAS